MKNKLTYEEVSLEIVFLNKEDVITTSAFNGPDQIFDWFNKD